MLILIFYKTIANRIQPYVLKCYIIANKYLLLEWKNGTILDKYINVIYTSNKQKEQNHRFLFIGDEESTGIYVSLLYL